MSWSTILPTMELSDNLNGTDSEQIYLYLVVFALICATALSSLFFDRQTVLMCQEFIEDPSQQICH